MVLSSAMVPYNLRKTVSDLRGNRTGALFSDGTEDQPRPGGNAGSTTTTSDLPTRFNGSGGAALVRLWSKRPSEGRMDEPSWSLVGPFR
jgi:hypothetical protein